MSSNDYIFHRFSIFNFDSKFSIKFEVCFFYKQNKKTKKKFKQEIIGGKKNEEKMLK